MGIRLFVGEIDELGIKIPRRYNYVHYARASVRLCNVIEFDLSALDVGIFIIIII